jgi:hypothetical protein
MLACGAIPAPGDQLAPCGGEITQLLIKFVDRCRVEAVITLGPLVLQPERREGVRVVLFVFQVLDLPDNAGAAVAEVQPVQVDVPPPARPLLIQQCRASRDTLRDPVHRSLSFSLPSCAAASTAA